MEEKLIKYFESSILKILDKGIPASDKNIDYYQGVTFNYICKYVLKDKYSPENVAKILIKLANRRLITPAPCGNLRNLVFFNYNNHWSKFKVIENQIVASYTYNDEMNNIINFINNCNRIMQ